MSIFTPPGPNLATAAPGESFHVRRIHFGLVRDRCADLGMREGDLLRCLRVTAGEVVVEFPEGHTTALELDYARFVEVAEPSANRMDPDRRVRRRRRELA